MLTHFFKKNKETPLHYKETSLFTKNELIFFKHLQKILPNRLVFPHLHLSSILAAKTITSDNKEQSYSDSNLNKLMIDFAIFDDELNLLCAIELESTPRSDAPVKTQSSSQYLKEAGIPYVKWRKSKLPTYDQMKRLLAPFAEPKSVRDSMIEHSNNEKIKDEKIKDAEINIVNESPARQEQMEDVEASFPIPWYQPNNQAESDIALQDEQNESNDDNNEYAHLGKTAPIPAVELSIIIEHDNPNALSLRFLRDLTPQNFIQREYPHIWHRICLFAENPALLNDYLDSLFSQDRPEQRAGLPLHVANEVILIKTENKHKIQGTSDENIWINGGVS